MSDRQRDEAAGGMPGWVRLLMSHAAVAAIAFALSVALVRSKQPQSTALADPPRRVARDGASLENPFPAPPPRRPFEDLGFPPIAEPPTTNTPSPAAPGNNSTITPSTTPAPSLTPPVAMKPTPPPGKNAAEQREQGAEAAVRALVPLPNQHVNMRSQPAAAVKAEMELRQAMLRATELARKSGARPAAEMLEAKLQKAAGAERAEALSLLGSLWLKAGDKERARAAFTRATTALGGTPAPKPGGSPAPKPGETPAPPDEGGAE